MTDGLHERWMSAALSLGRRGMGATGENPSVGCLIVKNDKVLGFGWTQRGGRPHAEIMALSMAGASAKGATAYVTLEPCAHVGKTGPCANALIKAGIQDVVIALQDPDSRVSGAGIEALAVAGAKVHTGVLAQQAAWDLAGFLRLKSKGLPLVTLKLAATLDGKIALSHGESKWITGELARKWGHLLRAQHDAIVTGARTVSADNPALTARVPGLRDDDPDPFVLASAEGFAGDFDIMARAAVIKAHGAARLPDAHHVLSELAARGYHRVMIEAGSGVAAQFLKAGLVDQIALFQAPALIGRDGLNVVGVLPLDTLADLTRWDYLDEKRLGQERYLTLRSPNWHEEVKEYV